jgi:tetratricopeptide (TPR) repeat protein
MGRLLLRRGNFEKSLEYLKQCWNKLTVRNSNPSDGQCSFLMGLCYEYLGSYDNAYRCYYKSVWNAAWQSQGFLALARLEIQKENYSKANEFVGSSLKINGLNQDARHLAVAIARKQDNKIYANRLLSDYLSDDPINFALLYEQYLLDLNPDKLQNILKITRRDNHSFIEVAVKYIRAGMYEDAFNLLNLLDNVYDPMVYYYQAFCLRKGTDDKIIKLIKKADELPVAACFPNRLDDILVLKFVIDSFSSPKAYYLLGNLYYDKRQYELAINYWSKSAALDDGFAIIHRNLAIGYFNKQRNLQLAKKEMEKAVKLDPSNARFIFEPLVK